MSDQTTETPATGSHVVESVTTRVVVDELTPEAIEQLRHHVEASSGGGSRIVWFIAGFVTALVAGVVAAFVFAVVSDADDDGNIEVDVPAVDLDVDG